MVVGARVEVDVVVDVDGTELDVVVASVDSGVDAVVDPAARSADAQLVSSAPATSVTTIQTWMGRGTGIGSCVMRRSSAALCPGHQ